MIRYSKKERLKVEDCIIATVRDYAHHGAMEQMVNHGLDTAKYFSEKNNRRIYDVYLKMHESNIAISLDSFVKYLNDRYESDSKIKMEIYAKFLTTMNISSAVVSPMNFEFYVWTFKEMIIQDYWNHIFKVDREDAWTTTDVVKNSFTIVS